MRVTGLECGHECVEKALSLAAVVFGVIADVDIQRDVTGFWPGMQGEVGFGQNDDACYARFSAKGVKQIADGMKAGGGYELPAVAGKGSVIDQEGQIALAFVEVT